MTRPQVGEFEVATGGIVMSPEDLQKAGLEEIGKKWA